MPNQPLPLPGLAFEPGMDGYAFDRMPTVRRSLPRPSRLLYDELMHHYRMPGWPIIISNAKLALALGWSVGNLRRELASLAKELIPGTQTPYIEIVVNGPKRRIFINAKPVQRGQSPVDCTKAQARAGARLEPPKARASARLDKLSESPEVHTPGSDAPVLAESPIRCINQTSNVNVISTLEKLACEKPTTDLQPKVSAEMKSPPETISDPTPSDPVAARLSAMTTVELEKHLETLRAALGRRPNDFRVKHESWLAAAILRDRKGLPVPITPRVQAITPPTPPPRPSVYSLAVRLRGSADPELVEQMARRLAEDFGDFGWMDKHRKTARQIQAGELDPRRVAEGHRRAMQSTVNRPGAVFGSFVFQRE